jgi:hypothetical protein
VLVLGNGWIGPEQRHGMIMQFIHSVAVAVLPDPFTESVPWP